MPIHRPTSCNPSFADTLGIAPLNREAAGGAKTLHVRCGIDIYNSLRLAEIRGDFLEYADPVCHGPVPAATCGEMLRHRRAKFLADWLGADAIALRRRADREEAGLWRAPGYERIIIWMEHDPYDQMILVRLLAWFARRHDCRDRVHLICIDHHPEIERFLGLGQLDPGQLAGLAGSEELVSAAQYALGDEAWRALGRADPTGLSDLAKGGTPALSALGPAIERYLQEYPWTGNGLGLTERLCLETLAEGARSPARLFGDVQRNDPLPYLGDAMFWPILGNLSDAPRPAIGPIADIRTPVEITDFGRELLAGNADWARVNGIDRWHGGVHLTGMQPAWRWDQATRTVVGHRSP